MAESGVPSNEHEVFRIEADESRSPTTSSIEDEDINQLPKPFLSRKAARSCSGHKLVIPEWVSDWKLSSVEKYLHIHYANDYLDTPKDVIQKISSAQELTEQQNQYIKELQKFIEFDSNYEEFWLKTSVVEEKIATLRSKLKPTNMLSQPIYISKGEIFINTFDSFFGEFLEAKKTRFQLFEGMFTSLIISLGQACCLTPSLCSHKQSQTRWNNLRGVTVKSKPDGRFFNSPTFGPSATLKPKALVSVIEVKNAKKFGYSGLKYSERKPAGRKRCISSNEEVSTDESVNSASTSGISSSSSSTHLSDMSEKKIPEIVSYISRKTLAQHAGELLLDLHKFRSGENLASFTLPGMIVDGTKVYFTLLEMSESHHNKLDKNLELTEGDRAIVHYAKPLDILGQEDRDLIIEILVRLHNI
ncbi:uncharacterized protein LOC134725157 [Mytilus trossulus]|uniref:uncharacterized protein LOC134725157 n=1 Tax=Mytilus trossulus TaxID=6551 RepID=UPI003005B28A